MATTASPYGLRPVRKTSGQPTGGALAYEVFPIKPGYTGVIPYGSPVVLTAPTSTNLTSISGTGTVATGTLTAHGYVVGEAITVSGVTPSAFNGTFIIASVPTSATFTYTYAGGAYASGTAAVLTDGGFIALPTNGTFNSLGDHYIGVFVGCYYTNTANNNQPQWDQWYPGAAVTAAFAHVVTDPEAVFAVQCQYPNFNAQGNLGYSYRLFIPTTPYNSGTKDSTIALDAGDGSNATSTTDPFKVVGIVPAPASANPNASGYVDVLVKAQVALHTYLRAL